MMVAPTARWSPTSDTSDLTSSEIKYEDYLLYEYREDEHSGKLFLKVITLFEYYPGTTEKKIRIDFRYTKQGDYSSLLYQGESYDGTYEEIRTDYPPDLRGGAGEALGGLSEVR